MIFAASNSSTLSIFQLSRQNLVATSGRGRGDIPSKRLFTEPVLSKMARVAWNEATLWLNISQCHAHSARVLYTRTSVVIGANRYSWEVRHDACLILNYCGNRINILNNCDDEQPYSKSIMISFFLIYISKIPLHFQFSLIFISRGVESLWWKEKKRKKILEILL